MIQPLYRERSGGVISATAFVTTWDLSHKGSAVLRSVSPPISGWLGTIFLLGRGGVSVLGLSINRPSIATFLLINPKVDGPHTRGSLSRPLLETTFDLSIGVSVRHRRTIGDTSSETPPRGEVKRGDV